MLGKIFLWIGIILFVIALPVQLFHLANVSDSIAFAGVCIGILFLFLAGIIIPPKGRNDNLSLQRDNKETDS